METKSTNRRVLDMFLVLLRTVIGWHFLYEGVSKLLAPNWSSYNFLSVSKWIFADFFQGIAANPRILEIVDFLNIWGLILIGLALFFGVLSRVASAFGIILLSLYYVANPPFLGMDFGVPAEGQYLIVNKNLIEIMALCVFVIIPSRTLPGLDRLFGLLMDQYKKSKASKTPQPEYAKNEEVKLSRRELVKNLAALPIFGGFVVAAIKKKGWVSYEEKFLQETDAITSATIKTYNFTSLQDLKSQVPKARIAGQEFSRVILGGNLIGGWAHARDLIYVSKLVKAYFHDDKVYETFLMAEKCGINAFLTNPVLCRVINTYWKRKIGKIKFISDCGGENTLKGAQMSIDNGASACYVHGGVSDMLVEQGKMDVIGKTLELIKENGLPAGIGGHKLETVKACVEYGLKPDFWMKTLHHTDYWSADPVNQHDNIWCTDPEDTIEYMKTIDIPWIAFKTLAAGAIHPEIGFRYAFENGADFICVGMYDFQIVDDVNIAMNVLNSDLDQVRQRPWMA
jgi:uncharacterized membrane protein YphA (DoxX/SURF4 family)